MIKIHVCLVSDQAAPNFLPLLDEALKPQEVVLLVTEQKRSQAEYLESVIRPLGIKVRMEPFEAAGSFDVLQQQLMQLLRPYPCDEIALNATGGTKWMAITAQEVFRMNGSLVFYVDIASGSVFFLDSQRAPHALVKKVKLESYLNAYGYTIQKEEKERTGLTEAQRKFCQTLIANVIEWQSALGQLNALAEKAKQNALRIALNATLDKEDPHLHNLLQVCESADLLTMSKGVVTFRNESARVEANGGWLESFIHSQLNELKAEQILQDKPHLNVVVGKNNTTNEIDVAFMANNKLHMIECKTKRFIGNTAGNAGKESLYKLDSISALGGLGTKSMLASYRPLSKTDDQRARELKIEVVQAAELPNIKNFMRSWIG
jgi:hypothetical protein